MPRKSKKDMLLSRLPLVEMREGLPMVERAEIEYKGAWYSRLVYVAGKCRLESREEHLICGDGFNARGIFQFGDSFDAIPFSVIGRYSPLKKDRFN